MNFWTFLLLFISFLSYRTPRLLEPEWPMRLYSRWDRPKHAPIQRPNFFTFKEPKEPNPPGLRSLAGRYDNPIPTRFLAPIGCLKIPAHKKSSPPPPPKGSKYQSMQEKKARQIRYTVIFSKHKRTGGLSQFAVFCHTSANCTKGNALYVPFPIHPPCCYSYMWEWKRHGGKALWSSLNTVYSPKALPKIREAKLTLSFTNAFYCFADFPAKLVFVADFLKISLISPGGNDI
jgi:hypothetical protein